MIASEQNVEPIRESITIMRPIASVWSAMTDEASVPRWLGCMRYRREVGAVFYMQQDREKALRDDVSGATNCEILALDEPHLFKFSWFVPNFPATTVSFALEAVDEDTTLVRFTHEGWDQFPPEQIKMIRDAMAQGWKSAVLPNLKRTSEG